MRAVASILLVTLLTTGFAGCFGQSEDEDGLSPEVESDGWDVRVVRVDGVVDTYHVTSSPYEADEDQDGLDDFQEHLHRTDPRAADTDRDGLLDGNNVRLEADSSLAIEWIAAGVVHEEAADGMLVFVGEFGDPGASHGAEPLQQDSDGDGLMDGEEVGGYSIDICGSQRHVKTLAWAEDTDGDSIDDRTERMLGLDPTSHDTDGDSVNDQNDLEPCGDLRLRFHVHSLVLDGTGGSDPVWFQVNLPQEAYRSDTVSVTRGQAVDGASFASGILDPSDDGADLRAGQYNLSFTVTLLTERDGQMARLDVFSKTTGEGALIARLDARDMEVSLPDGGELGTQASFSGADGSVTLAFTRPTG